MSYFITFEGIEGSGKTTQLSRLRAHLTNLGHQVLATREPGGCAISDTIRALLLDPANAAIAPRTELLLYSASRSQHVAEVIRPALAKGIIVLCDRFADATTVYQGAGRGLDLQKLDTINRFATDGLIPDLTLLLDFPVAEGLQRARARNQANDLEAEGRFESETLDFHRRIRQGYLELAALEKRFQVINANNKEDSVAESIKSVVNQFLASRRSA